MGASITCIIVGLIVCFFAIRNMKGDISSLHSYHRNNVKEEDVKEFGKMVGLGTLIVGVSVVLMGIFQVLSLLLNIEALVMVGTVVMFVGLIVGIVIAFYAMKKYNGGIFG